MRANALELKRRCDIVLEKLVSGCSASMLCREMSAEWGISERQVERYLSQVYGNLRAYNELDIKDRKAVMQERLEDQLKRANEEKNRNAALRALDVMARVNGLDSHITANVQVNILTQIEEDRATLEQYRIKKD